MLFTLAWLVVTNLTIYFIYLRSVEAVKEKIRAGLLHNVGVAATSIDGDMHRQFTARTSRRDPTYLAFIAKMEKLRQASRDVRYLYTNIQRDEKVYFIANGSPQNDNNKDGKPDEAPQLMDPYPDAGKALREALRRQEPVVDKEPYTDIWGTFYSAYAPFKDSKGRFVGTLGMDLELTTLQQRLRPIRLAAQRAAFTSGVLAILFGTAVWFFRSRNGILMTLRARAESLLSKAEQELIRERNAAAAQLLAVADQIAGRAPSVDPAASSAPTSQMYAEALKTYAMVRQGIRFQNDENFDPAELVRGILPEDIQLDIAADVPNLVLGDQDELREILRSLCFRSYSQSLLGSLRQLSLKVVNEKLNALDLTFTLRFSGQPEALDRKALIEDRDRPEHVTDADALTFATCCEQVRSQGGSVLHSIDEDSEMVVLTIPFQKFRED